MKENFKYILAASLSMTLSNLLRTVAVGALLACSGPKLATRSYSNLATQTAGAYLNIRDILADLCCRSLGDSYPSCKHFEFDGDGFYCEQLTADRTMNPTNFRWDEITAASCKEPESIVHIIGRYDSNWISANSSRQCADLAQAINTYIGGLQ